MILFWFFLTAAVLIMLQNILFKKLSFRRLQYSRRFNQATCFQGEEIEMIETISNNKRLPIPWLYIESQLEASLQFGKQDNFSVSAGKVYQNHQSFFTIKGLTKITRTHKMMPARRGKYRLRTVTMTSGDLFGLSRRVQQIPLHSELTVFPKPYDLSLEEMPYHSWQGDQSVKRFIMADPFVIAGAREYQWGDTFKQVNWKATARVGELQVHQYDYTADRKLMIVVNVDDTEGMWRVVTDDTTIEQAISYAAGAAEMAIAHGMQAGFSANMRSEDSQDSIYIEPSSGETHWYHILDVMAGLQLERTEVFSQLLDRFIANGVSHTDFLFISTYWNEELEQRLQRIRSYSNAAMVWLMEEHHSDKDGQSETPVVDKEGVG